MTHPFVAVTTLQDFFSSLALFQDLECLYLSYDPYSSFLQKAFSRLASIFAPGQDDAYTLMIQLITTAMTSLRELWFSDDYCVDITNYSDETFGWTRRQDASWIYTM